MEERMRRFMLLLRLYMFLYKFVKHVVDIQALFLQGEWKKFAILSLVYESIGYKERSICSQEQMYKFVDHLLLVSKMEKEFRKRTQIKYITFIFLCTRLDSYLEKDDIGFKVTMPVQKKCSNIIA